MRAAGSVDKEIAAGEFRIGSQIDPQLPESRLIPRSRQMGDVHLASRQFPELAQRQFRGRIAVRTHAQSNQGLVQIQTHTAAPEDVLFQKPDRINHTGSNQLKLIRQLNREYGITIVMVLHDINQSLYYSDEIVAMKDGRMIAHGLPEEIISGELVQEVYDVNLDIRTVDGKPFVIPV